MLFHFLLHWFIITGHGLYCLTTCSTGSSYLVWFAIFHLMLHWFILTGHCLYLFASLTGSLLLDMVCIVPFPSRFIIIKHDLYLSFQASLVHHHWAWFASFYYTLHWFFLTGHGLHCFTSCFTVSFLLGIVCIFSLPTLVHLYWAWLVLFTLRFTASFFLLSMASIFSLPAQVHNYWAWFVLCHFPHWFIITGHCLCSSNSHLTGSSLLDMVYIVSLHALLVPPYWSMFVLIHFSHWFIITGYGLFCFTSCFTGSSSLGMVCIAWLRASLVLHYWVWFVLFHFAHWFIIIKHDLDLLFENSLVHHHWAWFVLFDYTLHWFFLTGRGSHCFI